MSPQPFGCCGTGNECPFDAGLVFALLRINPRRRSSRFIPSPLVLGNIVPDSRRNAVLWVSSSSSSRRESKDSKLVLVNAVM